MEGLFKSLALQHVPANMQNIDRKKSGKLHVFESMVHVGHGKPEKLWNFGISFSRHKKSWKV